MCLIIVIILYISLEATINNTCIHSYKRHYIPFIVGTKIDNLKISGKLGFPTLTIKLEKSISCGFYEGLTHYGQVIMIVGKYEPTIADVNFRTYRSEIEKIERLDIWNLNRLIANESDIVKTFNDGCCE